jgi:uncharacterized protein YciI
MPRWAAIFEDHPGGDAIRVAHKAAHLAYLEASRDRVRIAGGLRDPDDAEWSGSLWIIDADTREEAVRIVENDPYFRGGLRQSYRLLAWGRAPAFGEVGSVGL